MYKVSKLKNGITLITVPVKGTMATTVMAMFPVGSRYETQKLSGASHFVEHMLFKGTEKRPTAVDISGTIEAYGADYNAYTYKDHTAYYVKINSQHQEAAFDLLADMIFHSKIEEVEVEKEKGAIVEELRMYVDNPLMDIDQLSDHVTFGAGNQLGWDIGGSEQTVRGISRAELWKYYQEHYAPRNMVLVVAGSIDAKKLKKYVAYFESQQNPPTAQKPAFYPKNYNQFSWPQTPPLADRVVVKEKKVDQAQMIMTFPAFKADDPNRYVLSVILNILGGGMSSRLFVEVRERRGLAYMVRAGSAAYRDTGVCYVQAGLDPARLLEALKVIKTELTKIATEPVSKAELAKAKSNLAGRMALGMEDSSSQAEWFAKYFFFSKKILTYEEVVKQINKVTTSQVKTLASKLLKWNEMRLAVIAPFGKEAIVEMLKKIDSQ